MKKKHPIHTLIAYGLPSLPLAALSMPVYIFLPTYYAQDLGIGLAAVGAMLLIARIFDVVTDPVIGVMCDDVKTTWGRRKPWVIGWTPLVLLASWFLLVPAPNADQWYLLLWSILLYFGWTCMLLPLNAWGAELSTDYNERSRIAGWREGLTVAGILAALGLIAFLGYAEEGNEAQALKTIALSVLIATPVSILLVMFLVPEPKVLEGNNMAFSKGLAVMKNNKPFRRLLASYLVNGFANSLPATLFLLFAEFQLQMPEKAGMLLFVYFLFGVLSVPVWLWLSYRYDKHHVWCGAMVLACMFFMLVPFVQPGDFTFFLIICMLTGFCLGADITLPASMQADVVDLDTLETGKQRTGLYFALWGMATKLSLALAAGFAFPVLEFSGFSAEAGGNTAMLVALYALFPIAIKFFAIRMMWTYPLNAQQVDEIQKQIQTKWT